MNELDSQEDSTEVNLFELFPHYYYHKIPYLLRGNFVGFHNIVFGGRMTLKSTTDCEEVITLMLKHPGTDVLCICYEESMIKQTAGYSYLEALKYLKIPEVNWRVEFPQKGDKYIDIWNHGIKQTIVFENAKNGSDRFHSYGPPNHGNKWMCCHLFEMGLWINWSADEISHLQSSIIRNAHENFGFIYEFNRPRRGSGNIWLMPWVDKLVSEQQSFTKDRNKFLKPLTDLGFKTDHINQWVDYKLSDQDDDLLRPSVYTMLWPFEKVKYLKGNAILEAETDKISQPQVYKEVYLAEEVSDGNTVYKYLENRHLGSREKILRVYDEIHIGVDLGRSDASSIVVTGFNYINKPLRVDFAIHHWYYSRKRPDQVFLKDDVKMLNPENDWDIYDLIQWIQELSFQVRREFPSQDIPIFLNIDNNGIGQAVYDALCKGLYRFPEALYFNRKWQRANINDRIDAMNLLSRMPHAMQIYSKRLFESLKHATYDDRVDEYQDKLKRKDDNRNRKTAMDEIDSMEYSFNSSEWHMLYRMAYTWFQNNVLGGTQVFGTL